MTTEERKQKRAQRRQLFEDYFERINNTTAYFTPKSVMGKNGKQYHHVLMFKSELNNPDGVYFETTDRDYNPVSPNLKLYHLDYDPFWASKYTPEDYNDELYRIPIENTEVVYVERSMTDFTEDQDMFSVKQDDPLNIMLEEIRNSINRYLNR